MNIHSLVEIFKNINIREMKYRVNHDMGSVWFTENLDPNSKTRIHVRITDNYTVLRLYYTDENGDDHRLTYQKETDRLRYSHVMKNTLDLVEHIVENALSYDSEEQLFQESLITDMGGFEFSDVYVINFLFGEAISLGKQVIQDDTQKIQ